MLSKTLENGLFDECLGLLTHLPQDMEEDTLFRCIEVVKIPKKRWGELRTKHGLEL
jgi:hypothetical protein